MRRVLAALTFAATVAFGGGPSHGADPDPSKVQQLLDAFCGLNLRTMSSLAAGLKFDEFEEARTTCRITAYGKKGLIMVFTASLPVFRIPAVRKSWAIIVVITAGKTIRDQGGSLFGVDYIGLGDSDGKIVRLPASYAEKFQADIHDGKLDPIVALDKLDKRLQEQTHQKTGERSPGNSTDPPAKT